MKFHVLIIGLISWAATVLFRKCFPVPVSWSGIPPLESLLFHLYFLKIMSLELNWICRLFLVIKTYFHNINSVNLWPWEVFQYSILFTFFLQDFNVFFVEVFWSLTRFMPIHLKLTWMDIFSSLLSQHCHYWNIENILIFLCSISILLSAEST